MMMSGSVSTTRSCPDTHGISFAILVYLLLLLAQHHAQLSWMQVLASLHGAGGGRRELLVFANHPGYIMQHSICSISGSQQHRQRTRHRLSRSPSRWNDMTSAPMMEAQVLSVMMFFTTGEDCPCTVTRLAIWMTGSLSGSGKWPCGSRPDMSNALLVHQHAGKVGAWRAPHGAAYSLEVVSHRQCTLCWAKLGATTARCI